MSRTLVMVALVALTTIEHDGEIYAPGATLELPEAQAVALLNVNAVDFASGEKATADAALRTASDAQDQAAEAARLAAQAQAKADADAQEVADARAKLDADIKAFEEAKAAAEEEKAVAEAAAAKPAKK